MKLLVCAFEYPPHGSGIANAAQSVVEELQKLGVDVTVCSPTGPDIVIGNPRLIRDLPLVGLLQYWGGVERIDGTDAYDAVWCHNPLFPLGSPLPRTIGTIHSTYRDKLASGMAPNLYYRLAAAIERRSLLRTARRGRLTTASQNVLDDLTSIGIDPGTVALIPNGVDTGRFAPGGDRDALRREFGIPDDEIVLLSLGRLSEAKRPERLVEVFAGVAGRVPRSTLVIAGTGERLGETRSRAVSLGVADRVRFLGRVSAEQVPRLYRLADCYVMASRSEGSPLSLLEALSSGLPAVVSDISPLRFVGDSGCGLVVDFDDPERAADRISAYLSGDLRVAGELARAYVEGRLDWAVISRRYLDLFEQVAEER
ncbi:MAG: glycosyltransferase family 4 protein [Methanospirillum sp.]|nr:glycosyltransferase family 4 protein [Methanospirillum sp.]